MGKKYEQTIKITTQFDPSEVVNGLKQIQQMAAGTKGYNPQHFKTVTANLAQAEALAKKLSELMQKGFTSPDDVRALKDIGNEFKKISSIVSEDLTTGIKRSFEDFSKSVSSTTSQLESDLKKIREQIANTLTEKGISGLKFKIDSTRKSLLDAVNSIKSVEDIGKIAKAVDEAWIKTGTAYQESVNAIDKKIAAQQAALSVAKQEQAVLQQQALQLKELYTQQQALGRISTESPFRTAGSFMEFFKGLNLEEQSEIISKGGDLGGKVGKKFVSSFQETILQGLSTSNATNKKDLIQGLLETQGLQKLSGSTLGDFLKTNNISKGSFETYISELMQVPLKLRTAYQQITQQIADLEKGGANAESWDKITARVNELSNALQSLNTQKATMTSENMTQMGAFVEAKKLLFPGSDFTNLVGSAIAAQDNLNKKQEEGNNAIDSEKTARENLLRLLQDQEKLTNRNVSALNEEANKAQTLGQIATNVNTTFNQLSNRLSYFVSIFTVFRKVRQVIKQTFTDVQNLDKAFSSIAMVTTNTVSGLWKQYSQYADIANKLGQTTQSAIEASALYVQQGLDMAQALELTESTLKLATLSQQDFKTTTKQLTSALRGFNMEMSEADHVTDVYSELAAHAAANVQEIAYSMSKVASIAASSGAKFENIAAFLTQMIN